MLTRQHAVRVMGLALLLVPLTARPAPAHALGAECKVRGDKVEVEAYYDDDTPARDAKVRVFDADNAEVAAGRTDVLGRWSFPLPRPGKYEVVVDAGAGHRCTQKITVRADPSAAAAPVVSDGPPREEFTRFPWLNLVLGIGLIGLVGLAVFGLFRRTKTITTDPT